MNWFLGVSVEQSPVEITTQKSYILDFLSWFGMSDCNPDELLMTAKTLIDKSLCLDFTSDALKGL